jgi:hypothetical protein
MNRKLTICGVVVLAAIVGLSLGEALTGYGIKGNKNLNVAVLGDGTTGTTGGSGGTGGGEKKKSVITTTREVIETYTRHSDGARCEKFRKIIKGRCEVGGTSICNEYTTTEEGISCTTVH